MKFNEQLKKKGLSVSNLPTEVQEDIAELKELYQELNQMKAQYAKTRDEDLLEEIDELEGDIIEADSEIAEYISSIDKGYNADGSGEEQKSSGMGWLVGGILLVASLGAYNYFKDKKQ
jgi:chromosome segregation ATPase